MKKFLASFCNPLARIFFGTGGRHSLKFAAVAGFFIFHFSSGYAQDTLVCRNGKKIVGKVISITKEKVTYILPPDSTLRTISSWRVDYVSYPGGTKYNFTERKKTTMPSISSLYLSVDAGSSVPAIDYRDGIVGNHFAVKGTFYFSHHVGVIAKAAMDLNGTGFDYISGNFWGGLYTFQQYLAGLTYRIGGKPGFPWVDFVALGGISKAANPVYESGGGPSPVVVTTPGSGSGAGYYIGIDFTSSSDHFCSLTFGAGCLGAIYTYPDYSTTTSTYYPYKNKTVNTISDPISKMGLALFQVYVGINFRLVKAGR